MAAKKKKVLMIAVCEALAAGVLFARYYSVPIPFDANRMFMETVASAFTTDEDWNYHRTAPGITIQKKSNA